MLNKLIKHTLNQGIELAYTKGSYIFWRDEFPVNKPKKITLENTGNEEHMMWDLLHELGHAEVRKDWGAFKDKYPAVALAEKEWMKRGVTRYKRRVAYQVELVCEEVEAWDAGLAIARRLRIDVDVHGYRAYAAKALATYMRYYGKKLAR
jgi:hypothetical protein